MSRREPEYPSKRELIEIRNLHTTPEKAVEYLDSIYSDYGFVKVENSHDFLGDPCKKVTIVTGGWSGNEDIIDELKQTMFWLLYWHSSVRGGKYEFIIPLKNYKKVSILGNPEGV